jgi:ribosomal protein S18 acetylase RimI-like enzyme
MPATYFKRYRMERDLRDLAPLPELPIGFTCLPWRNDLLEIHAEVKFQSFRDTLDSVVFPNLGIRLGCSELMRSIVSKSEFLPEATLLLVGPHGGCATVQGVRDRRQGAIQNVGVVPDHRSRGLGEWLMLKALFGFQQLGLRSCYLEVTARNESAVRLYRRLGFHCTRTFYKSVMVVPAVEEVTI